VAGRLTSAAAFIGERLVVFRTNQVLVGDSSERMARFIAGQAIFVEGILDLTVRVTASSN